MKKPHLLLVTAAMEEVQVLRLLARMRKMFASAKVVLVRETQSRTRAPLSRARKSPGVLTPRQTEVLREIATGTCMKEIARRLTISLKTVETHRQNLVERLGINDVPGLVRYALRTGVVPASWLME